MMDRHTDPPQMAHVIVRREEGRYVAQLADDTEDVDEFVAEGESADEALREMLRLLGRQVKRGSTKAERQS